MFGQPSWNEQFDFYLDSMDYPLELKIIERDKFGDHFVGTTSSQHNKFHGSLHNCKGTYHSNMPKVQFFEIVTPNNHACEIFQF